MLQSSCARVEKQEKRRSHRSTCSGGGLPPRCQKRRGTESYPSSSQMEANKFPSHPQCSKSWVCCREKSHRARTWTMTGSKSRFLPTQSLLLHSLVCLWRRPCPPLPVPVHNAVQNALRKPRRPPNPLPRSPVNHVLRNANLHVSPHPHPHPHPHPTPTLLKSCIFE
jgi:hypothetical protein